MRKRAQLSHFKVHMNVAQPLKIPVKTGISKKILFFKQSRSITRKCSETYSNEEKFPKNQILVVEKIDLKLRIF